MNIKKTGSLPRENTLFLEPFDFSAIENWNNQLSARTKTSHLFKGLQNVLLDDTSI